MSDFDLTPLDPVILTEALKGGAMLKAAGRSIDDWAAWLRSNRNDNGVTFREPTEKMKSEWAGFPDPPPANPALFKDTNPKDAVGVRKWRYFSTVSHLVLAEVGVAMLEGAMKYGRHNYRVAGVRASVYFDAAMGHMVQWWEGEDTDQDTGLSHVTKAIASLFVLRDAMVNGMLTDDRPPQGHLTESREHLQGIVDAFFAKYPEPKAAYTITDTRS